MLQNRLANTFGGILIGGWKGKKALSLLFSFCISSISWANLVYVESFVCSRKTLEADQFVSFSVGNFNWGGGNLTSSGLGYSLREPFVDGDSITMIAQFELPESSEYMPNSSLDSNSLLEPLLWVGGTTRFGTDRFTPIQLRASLGLGYHTNKDDVLNKEVLSFGWNNSWGIRLPFSSSAFSMSPWVGYEASLLWRISQGGTQIIYPIWIEPYVMGGIDAQIGEIFYLSLCRNLPLLAFAAKKRRTALSSYSLIRASTIISF